MYFTYDALYEFPRKPVGIRTSNEFPETHFDFLSTHNGHNEDNEGEGIAAYTKGISLDAGEG